MFETKKKKSDIRVPGGIRHYLSWARSKVSLGYKKWSSKRIAFVSVLIAISLVFFLISVRIIPISALPSYKFSFIGLPVKITGFIFGPIIGMLTGILADLISFLLVPTYYHYLYTISISIAGFIPGLCGYYFFGLNEMLFSNKYKIFKFKEIVDFFKKQYSEATIKGNTEDVQYFSECIAYYEVKIILLENKAKPIAMINFAFFSALAVLTIQVFLIISIFIKLDPSYFENNRFIKNKLFYIFATSSGFVGMGVFLILFRIFIKKRYQLFIDIMAIVTFSAILEFLNVIILSWADAATLKIDFWVNLANHSLTGPIKIFFNVVIITTTYRIVAPLLKSKEGDKF